MKNSSRQFLRFIIIGIQSTIVNYLFYIFLYQLTSNIFLSAIVGYSSGLINSYIFGKNWVFKNSEKDRLNVLFRFILVYLIGAFIMVNIIRYLSFKGIDYRLAWSFAICLVIFNNFLGSKYFVFKR